MTILLNVEYIFYGTDLLVLAHNFCEKAIGQGCQTQRIK